MTTKDEARAVKQAVTDWLIPHPDVVGVGIGRAKNGYGIVVDCKERDYTWPEEWDGVAIRYVEGAEVPKAQDA